MEVFIKGTTLFFAFVTLVLTGISSRRAAEKHQKEMLNLDLEILKKLDHDKENAHFSRISAAAAKQSLRVYPNRTPYYPVYFRVGLYVYVSFGFMGLFAMFNDYPLWSVLAFYAISLAGFEIHRRGLSPRMDGEPEGIEISKEKT